MKGVRISEKDFDELSDEFKSNNKVLKDFERRELGISDSEEPDDECIFLEEEDLSHHLNKEDKVEIKESLISSENILVSNRPISGSGSIQINVQNITLKVHSSHQQIG
jgi:hypothetical protein